MYSPKISDDLIPILYQLSQVLEVPMTKVVEILIRSALKQQGIVQKLIKDEFDKSKSGGKS